MNVKTVCVTLIFMFWVCLLDSIHLVLGGKKLGVLHKAHFEKKIVSILSPGNGKNGSMIHFPRCQVIWVSKYQDTRMERLSPFGFFPT